MQMQVEHNKANQRKYPEQVIILTAKDKDGKHNPMIASWTMITSFSPPMMAVSVGLRRHTLQAVRHSKEFVITFPSVTMEDEVICFGSKTGKKTDKLAESGAQWKKATKIDSVIFEDAVANFECKLVSELVTGDHVIFAGEIVCSHMHEDESLQRIFAVSKGGKLGALQINTK